MFLWNKKEGDFAYQACLMVRNLAPFLWGCLKPCFSGLSSSRASSFGRVRMVSECPSSVKNIIPFLCTEEKTV